MSKGAPILLATTIFVLQEGGNYKQYHHGEAVPGLNDEQVERLTKCGALGTTADLEPEVVVGAEEVEDDTVSTDAEDDADGSGEAAKPEGDANKPALVKWIFDNVTKDDGSDYTKSELNKLTIPKLWDIINSVE